MDVAVTATLAEVGEVREIKLAGMLHDEESSLFNQLFLNDGLGDGLQFGQIVRWIGKDQVELLRGMLQVFEHIRLQRKQLLCTQQLLCLADEIVVQLVHLHAHHIGCTAGDQFEGDAARTGEEIQRGKIFPRQIVVEHVEEALFRKISGGTCF